MSSVTDINKVTDSSTEVKNFFDRYYSRPVSFDSNKVDVVVGFFKKRGFEESAATATASVILNQAKKDKINVIEIIDTLKGLDDVQINRLVATILNSNRSKLSSIGYKTDKKSVNIEQRNIINLPNVEDLADIEVDFSSDEIRFDNNLIRFDKV